MISRQAGGFVLRVIDTPGLIDGDSVHEDNLNSICAFLVDKEVDAVLFVDRLDTYRLQTVDVQIIEALTARFGQGIWALTMFVLTHGNVPTPAGQTYGPFAEQRASLLRDAVRKVAPDALTAQMPSTVVENGSRCKTNTEGERVLNDGTVWLTQLLSTLVSLVQADEKLDVESALEVTDVYGARRRWMVWPLLAVQMLVLKPLMCRQVRLDPDFN